MSILIGYQSALGSTRGIAEHIAKRLADQGFETDVRSMDQVDEITGYQACVLGSAVHNMAWLPPAVRFAEDHLEELAERPLWLFSVGSKDSLRGPIGRFVAARYPIPRGIAELSPRLHPRGHEIFTGVIRRDQYPRVSRLVVWAMGGRYGDFRDWEAIGAWADAIGRDLKRDRP